MNLTKKINKFINLKWVNKFTLSFIVILVWLTFFNKYNWSTHSKLSSTISSLEENASSLDKKILETQEKIHYINRNKEKYAREKYYMHKPNEDIVVINQSK